MSWTAAILPMYMYIAKKKPFYESNYNACKYKTVGFIGLYSLHIEPPRN